MRIAVIGTSNVGQAPGRGWANLGHAITFGSRAPDSERVQRLVPDTGGATTAMKTAAAASA